MIYCARSVSYKPPTRTYIGENSAKRIPPGKHNQDRADPINDESILPRKKDHAMGDMIRPACGKNMFVPVAWTRKALCVAATVWKQRADRGTDGQTNGTPTSARFDRSTQCLQWVIRRSTVRRRPPHHHANAIAKLINSVSCLTTQESKELRRKSGTKPKPKP